MNKLQMNMIVRDITVDREFAITLPVDDIYEETGMKADHEYIIVEHDGTLPAEELTSICRINEVLKEAEEAGFSKEMLTFLSQEYLLSEIQEIVKKGSVNILNFTDGTATWNSGNGGNISEEDFGRFLYEKGHNFLPFLVPTYMMDYITWYSNWEVAECNGWRQVRHNAKTYLVNGGI